MHLYKNSNLLINENEQKYDEEIRDSDNISKTTWKIIDEVTDHLKTAKQRNLIFSET